MPYVCLGLVLTFTIVLSFGVIFIEFEENIFDLWTPTDSPIFREREFIKKYWSQKDYGLNIITAISKDGLNQEILNENNLNEWFEFHINYRLHLPQKTYTWTDASGTVGTVEFGYFADHLNTPLNETYLKQVGSSGNNSEISNYLFSNIIPLCRPIVQSQTEAQFIYPCYTTHIFDCFNEGNILFPYEYYLSKTNINLDINPYLIKPSYKGLNKNELIDILLNNQCILSGNQLEISKNEILGGALAVDIINSFQTLAYLDSPYNIDKKFKIARGECNYTSTLQIACQEPTDNELQFAKEFLHDWLLDYIDYMKDFINANKKNSDKNLDIKFWTPRTAEDLLKDASQGDIFLLILAFILMIAFSSFSAVKFCPSNLFHQRAETSTFGTIFVLLAVSSAIGATSYIGLKLSPATIQVLPFIALGFGVDDMFIILFSFRFNKDKTVPEMICETMRIAGSSVAATTVANFFGFYIGTFVNLKDVQIFSYCGMITETINFIVIIFGFTSILTLTARRSKNRFKDCSFCCCFNEKCKVRDDQYKTQKPLADRPPFTDPLFHFLSRNVTRFICTILFFILIIIGLFGATLIKTGLPFADLMPEGTYAQEYLVVREKFYHSYIVSLYTDAFENVLKPIDWKNKFEAWILNTNSYVGSGEMIEMWASEMQQFLSDEYKINHNDFTPYELSMDELKIELKNSAARIGTYKSFVCEKYRSLYCSKPIYIDYPLFQYNGASYNCLRANQLKIPVNDDCLLYLDSLIPHDIVQAGIAKQIYIYNPMDDDDDQYNININGLYVTNHNNKLNIYSNRQTNYILYQRESDNKWILFDDEFNMLYITNSTTGSIPPSGIGGWHTATVNNSNTVVPITVTYWNNTYYLQNILRDTNKTFLTSDVTDINTASMIHTYIANTDNIKAHYKYELMKMVLEISPVFTNIKLSIDTNNIECSAVFSATTACKAILNEETAQPNPIDCLKVSANDPNAQETTFWVGNCNQTGSSEYTISAIAEATEFFGSNFWTFDEETSCNCENPSNWISDAKSKSFNYFVLPSHTNNINSHSFGGYVDNSSTTNICNQQSPTIELSCESIDSCETLAACFEDSLSIMKNTACGGTFGVSDLADITDFLNRVGDNLYNSSAELFALTSGGNIAFATCLISYYDDIESDCCRNAVDHVLIQGLKKHARQLTAPGTLHFYGPCNMLSTHHWNDGVTTQNPCNLLDICTLEGCLSSPAPTIYLPGCFNDFSVDCKDDIDYYNCNTSNAISLLNCLTSVSEPESNLFPCCDSMLNDNINFTTTITPNCILPGKGNYLCTPLSQDNILQNVYTMDCEIDASVVCTTIFDIDTCKQSLKSVESSLSINCRSTLNICEYENDEYGEWFVTNKDTYSNSTCPSGSIGTRQRYCNSSDDGYAIWNEAYTIDTSECIRLYCPAGVDSIGNKDWNSSYANKVQRHYGLNIPTTWTDLYNDTCDPSIYTFELTRKCSLINDTYVEWEDPILYCRSEHNDLEWLNAKKHLNKRCDTDKSSLIYGLKISDISGSISDTDVSYCQTYCSDILSPTCIAFEYASTYYPTFNYLNETYLFDSNNTGPFCLFYDNCKIISDADSIGINTYIAPFSGAESIENYCGNNGWESWNENGIPSLQCFNASLWHYFTQAGVINQDKIIFNDQSLLYDNINGYKYLSIVSTYNSFIINGIDDDDIAVEILLDLRKYVDDLSSNEELYVIPGGLLIDLFSQYIGVREQLLTNLVWVCLCVAISGLVFLLNWWSVVVVILCNAAMIIQVYGFSHWAGLRVNAVFVLNIIIAIGLTLEFTAHVGRAFVLTTSNKNDVEQSKGRDSHAQIRMKKTLREMFVPVSLGAFTTLLGVIPIAFARFPYFRQYYFLLYVIIVTFGWVNGVIFQPIILSWLPPTPFVYGEETSSTCTTPDQQMIELEQMDDETNKTSDHEQMEDENQRASVQDEQMEDKQNEANDQEQEQESGRASNVGTAETKQKYIFSV